MAPDNIIVSGPVIVKDGKVLLDISGRDEFWKFCGDQVKPGERFKMTAIRRAKEELGIEIIVYDSRPFLFHREKKVDGQVIDVILVHFISVCKGEILLGRDVYEAKWHPLDDLPANLAPNIIPALKHFGFLS